MQLTEVCSVDKMWWIENASSGINRQKKRKENKDKRRHVYLPVVTEQKCFLLQFAFQLINTVLIKCYYVMMMQAF